MAASSVEVIVEQKKSSKPSRVWGSGLTCGIDFPVRKPCFQQSLIRVGETVLAISRSLQASPSKQTTNESFPEWTPI